MNLPYTESESQRAIQTWKANCGPHALAAITNTKLEVIRKVLRNFFKGWTNPTMMKQALIAMKIDFTVHKVKTDRLCRGLNRIQWEGDWLEPGVPARVAYMHTHWVAARDGYVLCTATDPFNWQREEEWRQKLREERSPWHVTHHYIIPSR